MGWYEDQMAKVAKAKPPVVPAPQPAGEPAARPISLEEALGSAPRAKPAPKPPAAPAKPDKAWKRLGLGTIPANDAWLIFRTVDGPHGQQVEHLRVTRSLELNMQDKARAQARRKELEEEPKDWDFDIPLLDPENPKETAQQAWQRFLLAWELRPEELVDALRAAATIEGLEHLRAQAEIYEISCGLKKEDGHG